MIFNFIFAIIDMCFRREEVKSKETNKSNKNTKKKNNTKKEIVTEKEITKATKKQPEKKNNKKDEEIKIVELLPEEEYNEYNEDLEETFEVKEEPKEKVKKEKVKKEKIKKEKVKVEKIEKIDKIAKEQNKKVKTKNNSKIKEIFLAIDKNRHIIYGFGLGVLLTVLVALIIWPDRIATLKDGTQPIVKIGKTTYTADDLYKNMKDYYSVSLLLDNIDNDLLTKLYPENDEMIEKVNSNAEYYINMYKQYYGYTEEQFLESNGFSNYNAFLDYLRLDHRRNKYLDEYIEKNLTDKEIQKYYDENVFGDINTQHVLVEVSSSEDDGKLNDADAKKLAEEIITKLNDGTTWEKIQEDYKDKITYEDLSYQSWDASLEESFMTALKEMEDNTYSEEPVKTSYGYHVIYRLDQKKQPSLKKSKEKIVEKLSAAKKEEDSNLLYKALIELRKEKNISFSDTDMKEKYNNYCEQYK